MGKHNKDMYGKKKTAFLSFAALLLAVLDGTAPLPAVSQP
jgi:hypothetical protein